MDLHCDGLNFISLPAWVFNELWSTFCSFDTLHDYQPCLQRKVLNGEDVFYGESHSICAWRDICSLFQGPLSSHIVTKNMSLLSWTIFSSSAIVNHYEMILTSRQWLIRADIYCLSIEFFLLNVLAMAAETLLSTTRYVTTTILRSVCAKIATIFPSRKFNIPGWRISDETSSTIIITEDFVPYSSMQYPTSHAAMDMSSTGSRMMEAFMYRNIFSVFWAITTGPFCDWGRYGTKTMVGRRSRTVVPAYLYSPWHYRPSSFLRRLWMSLLTDSQLLPLQGKRLPGP